MSLPALEGAIHARAITDTGTGGLFAATPPALLASTSRFIAQIAARDARTLPQVTYAVRSSTESDTFTTNGKECEVEFVVVDGREDANTSQDCAKIMARIMALFHRWEVGALTSYASGTGWTAGMMTFTGEATEHDQDTFVYVMSFRVRMDATA